MYNFIFAAALFILGASAMKIIFSMVEGNYMASFVAFVVAVMSLVTIDKIS